MKGKGHGAAQSVMAMMGQGAGHGVIAGNNATEWCGALEAKCSDRMEDREKKREGTESEAVMEKETAATER